MMKLLTSIYYHNFFGWYTQRDDGDKPSPVDQYKHCLDENIFSCIEMLNVGYKDIMIMPIRRFENLLKWKAKLEEQKMKLIEEK